MQREIYCNGHTCTSEDAFRLLDDISFQRGYAAFETVRTYAGRPFELDAHLNRLKATCDTLALTLPQPLETVKQHVLSLKYHKESKIRIYLTAGTEKRHGDVYLFVEPLMPPAPEVYERGIHAVTTQHARFLPEIKSTNYAAMQYVLRHSPHKDAQEVILLNPQKEVLEGGTSNMFGVIRGHVYTAPSGVLPGVTRACLLKLLSETVSLRFFRIDQLDECFLTSSTRDVLPITKIDGKSVGEGVVGPVTKAVMAQYAAFINEEKQKQ